MEKRDKLLKRKILAVGDDTHTKEEFTSEVEES